MQRFISGLLGLLALTPGAYGQSPAGAPTPDTLNDPVRIMVTRLGLERYKGTVKGLTQFGDRRQGTDRNRAAGDWIEAQLKSYGCTNTERITYTYDRRQLNTDSTRRADSLAGRSTGRGGNQGRGGNAGR